jgi:hypothetical protein
MMEAEITSETSVNFYESKGKESNNTPMEAHGEEEV